MNSSHCPYHTLPYHTHLYAFSSFLKQRPTFLNLSFRNLPVLRCHPDIIIFHLVIHVFSFNQQIHVFSAKTINTYAPNIRVPKYMKQILTK